MERESERMRDTRGRGEDLSQRRLEDQMWEFPTNESQRDVVVQRRKQARRTSVIRAPLSAIERH